MTKHTTRGPDWDCMTCGEEGTLPPGEDVDSYQCPSCGEPVFPR